MAISVTGVARPFGGTNEKPVGLVYIGCFVLGKIFFEECHFNGDRLQIREQSANEAINFALKKVTEVIG